MRLVLLPLTFLFLWSSGAVFVKLGLLDSSPWSFLLLRCSIAFAVMVLIIGPRRLLQEWRSVAGRGELKVAVTSAIALQACYLSFYFLAIFHRLSPGLLAIVLAAQPMCAAALGRERNGVLGNSLLLFGFAGVILAIIGARDVSQLTGSGIVFAVLSMLSSAFGSVSQKRLTGDIRAAAALQYLVATGIFALFVAWDGWQVHWSARFSFALCWMTFAVSIVAMLLYLHMLATEPISRVNALLYLVPVCTIALDGLVFGQRVSPTTVTGMTVVIAAVWAYRRYGMRFADPSSLLLDDPNNQIAARHRTP